MSWFDLPPIPRFEHAREIDWQLGVLAIEAKALGLIPPSFEVLAEEARRQQIPIEDAIRRARRRMRARVDDGA